MVRNEKNSYKIVIYFEDSTPEETDSSINTEIAYPTFEEFSNALTSNDFPTPSENQYKNFVSGAKFSGFSSKIEIAMFLAQLM